MAQNLNVTPDVQIQPLFLQAFNYADKTNTLRLEDWLSILTLCLSPLIAHILSGVPTVVRRCPSPPTWLDTLCLYNPTSILWRYLAIVERRVRYRHSWDAADMAATNALFWTPHGFDGSEDMMRQSRSFCARIPRHHRTEIWSIDSIKTVIITLQGVQALVVLVRGVLALANIGNQPYNATISMSTIFYPLAVIGLLRLFAAPWLTDDYAYHEHETYESSRILAQHTTHTPSSDGASYTAVRTGPDTKHTTSLNASLLPRSSMAICDPSPDAYTPPQGLHLPTLAVVVIVRCCYLGLICAILAICACYMIPYNGASEMLTHATSSSVLWLLIFMYIVFILVSIVLFVIYLIQRGRDTTTIIPCIRTWWYRAYTLVFIAAAVALIILSGVYTRRTSCGQLTVFPPTFDQQVCNGTPMQVDKGTGPFGIVTQAPGLTPETWILPLEGWCSGTLTGEIFPVVSVS
ncbi:hypothetical protein BDV36DRAFT_310119 [Aspergillus pseudocaelatus]|uniref:SUR7/PalI family-domain-containing protein n=1 Tax=Aspergillus pseudocaelatus TaxID=1825620 RepID=A0ABQ6WH35_9EURO|nr:hypothetical protein BDV36DRAFT_310119 [Aspergillus pseudocaelatus]